MHIHTRNALIYGLIRKKALVELYANVFIRSLATSLVGIFIPLYLYKEIGYSLQQVFMFFAMLFAILVVLSPFIPKVVLKIGVKYSMLLGSIFTILFYVLLNALTTYNIPLALLSLVYALNGTLYWIPYHLEFSRHSDHKNRGTEIGVWYSLFTAVGVIGPVLGAFIATYLGFSLLYFIAIGLFIIATVPILFIKERKIEQKFGIKSFMFGHAKKDILVYISDGIRSVVGFMVWPVFMFVALGTYLAVGSIKSIIAVFGIVVSIFIGKLSDKYNKITIMRIGVVLSSITFFIRSLFSSLTGIFAITTIGDLSEITLCVPLHSKLYDKIAAKGHRRIEYIVFREVWLSIGRATILGIIVMFGSMELSFVLTGFTNFLLFFL